VMVFCFFAVLNMCDSDRAVREMSRVLKPGGCALVSLSSVNDKRQFRISRQRVELKKLFTKAELIGLFEKNGDVTKPEGPGEPVIQAVQAGMTPNQVQDVVMQTLKDVITAGDMVVAQQMGMTQ